MNTLHKIPNKMMPFLWYFVKKQPVAFTTAFLTALVWSLNEVFFPYFIKVIINVLHQYEGNAQHIYGVLWKPVGALLACWLFMDIAMRTQGLVLTYAFPKLRANIRIGTFNYTKHHSHQYFSNNFAGSIAQKLSSLPTSCQNVLEVLIFTFCSITVGFIMAFCLMWATNPIFSWILLGWLTIHMGLAFLFLRSGNAYWESHSQSVTTLSGKIVDSISNSMSVRVFARHSYETSYVENAQRDEMKKAHKASLHMEIMKIFQGMAGIVFIFSMIMTLIYGWVHRWVTLGDFSLIGMLSFWILGMVWYLSYQMAFFVRERSTINEALTLIGVRHDIKDAPDATTLTVKKATIEFDQVIFEYEKNKPIFKKLNITIPAGQKVGLVGFSGSGKSTCINLLLRLYDLTSGRILIDSQDIAKTTQNSLRENIAIIPQDPSLFHRTLMENIRYGRLNATDEEVITASKLAHCHEYIEELDEGYEALVGERGVKLSGGQRQRIAIARAILKNAPILILDEATSALDSVTEKLIQSSLKDLMQDKTTLVIAHRLSTLADMDRILVFDEGKIVEEGTQEELLQKNGHFAQLWHMQMDGFLPERGD